MTPGLLIRSLITAIILFCGVAFAKADDGMSPVSFHSEGDQSSFTLKKGLQPIIAEIELQVFARTNKVFEVRVPSDQPLVWPRQHPLEIPGQPLSHLAYGCRIGLKAHDGTWLYSFGYFHREWEKPTFSLSENRNNLPGPTPVEFYQSLTRSSSENAAAWLFYGIALTTKHKQNFVFLASPPPPPPQPPPPPPPGTAAKFSVPISIPPSPKDSPADMKRRAEEEKARQAREAEEEKQWKANKAAMREEFNAAALPAIRKAYDLATECQTKDAAMFYLAWMASSLNDGEQARQWLLKRAESDCASKEAIAESYYALGVEEWACADQITEKYRDRKAGEPFHFRKITSPSDKRQFDNCLGRSEAYMEKALEANPDYGDAMAYKGMIYREKQKVTADPAERKKLEDEAIKTFERAGKLEYQRLK